MGPDASSGLSNPRPNFEDPATQSFDFEFLPGGSIQIIAESDEHLVSQPMQEKFVLEQSDFAALLRDQPQVAESIKKVAKERYQVSE